jgi:nucleotide-binding universal stress UspA family protein
MKYMFENQPETLDQQIEKGTKELQRLCAQITEAASARVIEAQAGVDNDRESDIEADKEAAIEQLTKLLELAERRGVEVGEKIIQDRREGNAAAAQTEMSLNN